MKTSTKSNKLAKPGKLKPQLPSKSVPKAFPLTSAAARIALLVGITAGTVGRTEVEAAVLRDAEARPYRKPVVAGGIYFPSITEAANDWSRPHWQSVGARQKEIARLCNADNVEGYYWAEYK